MLLGNQLLTHDWTLKVIMHHWYVEKQSREDEQSGIQVLELGRVNDRADN